MRHYFNIIDNPLDKNKDKNDIIIGWLNGQVTNARLRYKMGEINVFEYYRLANEELGY